MKTEQRPLKFRVWSLKYKNFVRPICNCTFGYGSELYCTNQGEVIIQQLTGLPGFDKNNNPCEIYEGDIVQIKCYEDWNDEVGYPVVYFVKWSSIHCGFRGFNKLMLDGKHAGVSLSSPIKVLGNICENLELLETPTINIPKINLPETCLLSKELLNNKNESKHEKLSRCEQCGEKAWDGYICHACGLKII